MPVTCARCGTQNPDANQFCQACGAPLSVAAAQPAAGAGPPPPPASTPPASPPGAYQSPYYAPSAVGPQPPVHRTPWAMIISAIVVLVVLMAGCGTAIAVLSNRSGNVDTPAGILASPSPGGTPGTPAPVTPGGTATSNKGVAFKVPAGWTVNSKDDQSIAITNPKGDGSVTIGSGTSSPSQTAEQNKETIDRFFAGKYPDTRSCSGSKTTRGALNGAQGISWEACFTLSAGGQSIQAEAKLFAGANSNGSVYYVVILLTPQSNIRRFVTETAPILQSVQWKLT